MKIYFLAPAQKYLVQPILMSYETPAFTEPLVIRKMLLNGAWLAMIGYIQFLWAGTKNIKFHHYYEQAL